MQITKKILISVTVTGEEDRIDFDINNWCQIQNMGDQINNSSFNNFEVVDPKITSLIVSVSSHLKDYNKQY
jgi:hypothetical protein